MVAVVVPAAVAGLARSVQVITWLMRALLLTYLGCASRLQLLQ
jgi:hypothetical protein